jgi:hypothetical protein
MTPEVAGYGDGNDEKWRRDAGFWVGGFAEIRGRKAWQKKEEKKI